MEGFREITEDDLFSVLDAHPDPTVKETREPRLTLVEEEPSQALVVQKATSFTEQLATHKIVDDASYLACDGLFVQAVTLMDEISATFDPIIAAANKAHQEALSQKAKYYKPVKDALDKLKATFLVEEGRRAAEAERLRLELEAKLRAEAEEQQFEEALALETAGHSEEAAQVLAEPTPEVHVPIEAVAHRVQPKLGSTSTRGTWKCTSVNLKELALAVAEGRVSEEYIKADMSALDARARADKTTFNVPGCKAQLVKGVSVRR